jgi:hypothetical protein
MTTTWHDIADQLTDQQIATLDDMERNWSAATADKTTDALLFIARDYAESNLTDEVMFGHIAPPADATRLFHWGTTGGDDVWSREFDGTDHNVAAVTCYVTGRQFDDGRCERWIALSASDLEKLTPAQARELATALREAADEVDR